METGFVNLKKSSHPLTPTYSAREIIGHTIILQVPKGDCERKSADRCSMQHVTKEMEHCRVEEKG